MYPGQIDPLYRVIAPVSAGRWPDMSNTTITNHDFFPRLQPMKIYRRMNLPERLLRKDTGLHHGAATASSWTCQEIPEVALRGAFSLSAAQLGSFSARRHWGCFWGRGRRRAVRPARAQADPNQVAPALPWRRHGAVAHGGRHSAAALSIIAVTDGGTAAKRPTIPRSPRLPISRRRRVPSRRCLVRSSTLRQARWIRAARPCPC